MSDLRLTGREDALRGGKRGPAIKPGQARRKLALSGVAHAEKLTMPPGAPNPRRRRSKRCAPGSKRAPTGPGIDCAERHGLVGVPRPAVRRSRGIAAAGRRDRRLYPGKAPGRRHRTRARSRPADAAAPRLLRPARTAAHARSRSAHFLNDKSPDAWERLIDSLLASPRYGEKWGRHWLDLVRYGDTPASSRIPTTSRPGAIATTSSSRSTTTSPTTASSRSRSPATSSIPDDPEARVGTGYYRVGHQPRHALQGGGPEPRREADRLRRHHVAGVSGPDGRLRPLPRSQVRSDSAARFLPHAGDLRAGRERPRLPRIQPGALLRPGRELARVQAAADRPSRSTASRSRTASSCAKRRSPSWRRTCRPSSS